MPTYNYHCKACNKDYEKLKKVADHAQDVCDDCGATAEQVILTPTRIDYLNMGVDLGFPTCADRWAKLQYQKNIGQKGDSNNERYGGYYGKD